MKTRISRRQFLEKSTIGAVAAAGQARLAAAVPERAPAPAKLPAGTIIDTHTHFYDPARPQGVPWPPKEDKLLYRTVLPEHYRALPKPQPVCGTVVVEASAWVEDNQWVLDLAAREPFIVGLVGNLPVGQEGFAGLLEGFAVNVLFRGLRVNAARLKEGLGQAQFLGDLERLAAKDLSLDVVGWPELLPDTARLARAIPGLRIVIDHLAGASIDGHAPDARWRAGMRAAAQHQNVHCKVSGLVEGSGRADGAAPRAVEFYRPVLEAIWECFGPERLIYGSNWPVSERFAPLAAVQQLVADYFGAKGQAALERVFWKNALAVYKWVQRAP
jgi:predicted TIM-barrel fold metal-dependent hydrolase